MNKLTLPAALVLTLAAGKPLAAEDSPTTRLSLKGLHAIGLRIEPIGTEAAKDGLAIRDLHSAVYDRLRKAGIRLLTLDQRQRLPHRPYLLLSAATSRLDTAEHLYSIRLEVTQRVALLTDPKVPLTAAIAVPARTWSAPNRFGIAPADQIAPHVRAAVGAMVDQFVDAYHKANPTETAVRNRRRSQTR